MTPRSALEVVDSGEIRLQKIERIIEQSKYGIHDLSNMKLDRSSGLPRFNMPLELGLFLGAKRFGDAQQRTKRALILDCEPYRYQKAISDIAGQDIQTHSNNAQLLIQCVRDFLHKFSRRKTIPGASFIKAEYDAFKEELPGICESLRIKPDEMNFNDLWEAMYSWQLLRDL